MKKARLRLTPIEYKFISVYHCLPETMYERLCKKMDAKKAAEKVNGEMMCRIWQIMQEEGKEKSSLYDKGFEDVYEDKDIPF